MAHAFHPADIVRIARLEATQRDVDGTAHPPPQPRIGEKGRIVVEVESGVYLVERSTDDGHTVWLAEFLGMELELIERRDETTEDR